jgi:hypothetical protein
MPERVVPMAGIEPATSPLPRECSTTEPHGPDTRRMPDARKFEPSPTCQPPAILERETGIEPASLAWKAKVLPLNYSRLPRQDGHHCPGRSACLRSLARTQIAGGGSWIRTNVGVSQQIYSLPPLTTRASLRSEATHYAMFFVPAKRLSQKITSPPSPPHGHAARRWPGRSGRIP